MLFTVMSDSTVMLSKETSLPVMANEPEFILNAVISVSNAPVLSFRADILALNDPDWIFKIAILELRDSD